MSNASDFPEDIFQNVLAFLDLSAEKDLHNNHKNVNSQTELCDKDYFRGSKIAE